MTLAVVTDSSACLPRALADSRGIEVVALHLDKETGTTSRPSVTELARAYRRAAGRADEVLAVHLSACLSGTVDNARLAAEEVNEALAGGPVTVVDTGTCSGGVGLAALAAAGAPDARRGAALALESASRSRVLFLVPDISHLRRGGRIDRTTALRGATLGIHPILEVRGGRIVVAETVRGAARARRHLMARAVRAEGGSALNGPRPPAVPVRLAVHDAGAAAAAQELEDELAEAMAASGAVLTSVLRSHADPALAAHVGPGALGVVVAPALGAVDDPLQA